MISKFAIFLIEYPSFLIYYYLRTHFNAQFFHSLCFLEKNFGHIQQLGLIYKFRSAFLSEISS